MSKLKTVNLQGKEYAQVKERIKKFREDTTNGSIETSSEMHGADTAVLKATVIMDLSAPDSKKATGQAFGKITSTKAFEKLETIAVGRALAFLGYLADGEVASSDEMEEFLEFQKDKKDAALERLNMCTTLDELRDAFSSLGTLAADKEVFALKESLKKKLA